MHYHSSKNWILTTLQITGSGGRLLGAPRPPKWCPNKKASPKDRRAQHRSLVTGWKIVYIFSLRPARELVLLLVEWIKQHQGPFHGMWGICRIHELSVFFRIPGHFSPPARQFLGKLESNILPRRGGVGYRGPWFSGRNFRGYMEIMKSMACSIYP